MKQKNEAHKKHKVAELKKAMMKGEIPWETVLSALSDKDFGKIGRMVKKMDLNKNDALNKSKTLDENEKKPVDDAQRLDVLNPSAGIQSEEPFPSSSSSSSEANSNDYEYDDVLNRALDAHVWCTDRSIVTIHDHEAEMKVDPFRDAGRDIGPNRNQRNPYSTVSDEMKPADPILRYSEVLTEGLNKKSYNEKLQLRKSLIIREKLSEIPDALIMREEDKAERTALENEYKRYMIDLKRKEAKLPEPNMIDPRNGECSNEWRLWFENRIEQIREWLLEDAINHELPPSIECNPPRGLKLLGADWNVFREGEIKVKWDYEKYGPMVLTEDMAYDGKKLYNPSTGQSWTNIVEHLEHLVKVSYLKSFPNTKYDVFKANEGYFWSQLLQQWYDIVNVSLLHFLIL